ncbi:Methyltransferase domain-containing protein [Tardiphaga sp. OK246]|uniref:class I SAM-dependent methyltransferase n=1 Tax=Tardiphaga sp. OK246 TaxID=1855307 RepID=UPI000B686EDB|nr:class I SAM-dependent methyltransferase [Tardiphaga sp. OK246]SNT63939.1 Methyltransferase domain-containing protein [Tardiphaga sp. OK246]
MIDLAAAAKQVGDDWTNGEYYDVAEASAQSQWDMFVSNMIDGADFTKCLDLAAGHGRNTARLIERSNDVVAVDINETNVEFMKDRFRSDPRVKLVQNNGIDLRDIPSASITFLFSYDAMVHFDCDVVHNYVGEFRRVMKPGAQGFCHYSNNYKQPTKSYRDHPGWRNFMSKQLFEHWLTKAGFRVVRSVYIRGNMEILADEMDQCDAATLFELRRDASPGENFFDVTDKIAQLESDLGGVRQSNEQLLAKLQLIENSRSWKLTEPLRSLMRRVR